MKRLFVVALAAIVLTGCGAAREVTTLPAPRPLSIALPGAPSALYAPVYAAISGGYFTRGGLAVTIAATGDGASALGAVNAGTATVAVVSELDLLKARATGDQLVAIGVLTQSPIALPKNGAGDAALALLNAETTTLDGAGSPPSYSQLVLVITLNNAHYAGPLLRTFLQSLTRAATALQSNPGAVGATLAAADHKLSAKTEQALATAVMNVAFPSTSSNDPYGFQSDPVWQTFGVWLQTNHFLNSAPAAGNAITDEFLPGQGE